jgi:uncharacterized alpha-E superfamily protein
MYRLSRRTRVSRADALEFALRDVEFPRACLYCLRQIELCLRSLPRSAGALAALAHVGGFLADASLATLDRADLHQLIDHLQLQIIGVHDSIAQAYFPAQAGSATQRQVEVRERGQARTLPLFADGA